MKTGISVSDAMTTKPIMLSPNDSLRKCAKEMASKHVSAILVGTDHQLKGIISDQDIVRKFIAKGINPLSKKISDFMKKRVTTITPEKDIYDALIIMRDLNIRHLPVVEGKKILGLLTIKDILKIEPQLFDLIVEKFELREEEKKPIFRSRDKADICQGCGEYTDDLKEVDGVLLCKKCRE